MKFPVTSSNQNAPVARWPDGRIALRALIETPMTLESSCALRSSSPMVLTSNLFGDDGSESVHFGPLGSACPPTIATSQSQTLVTSLVSSRSYQAFPTIPLTAGMAPDMKILGPTAVTVGTCA